MKSINVKFLLIFSVILALNVGTSGFVSIFLSTQKSDGRIINLAARQRMLSQKMTKEALLLSRNGGDEEFKTSLSGTVSLFDRTLKGLAEGDAEFGLPPAANDEFLTQLGKVKSVWKDVKDIMDVILKEGPESPLFQKALSAITSQNMHLLKEANDATTIYENIARDKTNFLWWVNIGIVILTVLVIVLGWIFVIQPLVKMLCRIILDLRDGSDRTVSASKQLSASSQSLSQGTTEQASSIEETTATIEEMSSMVKQNADNAREAVQLVNLCNASAEKGNHAVTETNRAMQEINESSKKIADILKVIDGIAFQTNLLALNAAVEAARAGEHGKGFAVVAEEVRNLAQRSAVAAKDTASLIQDSVQKADTGAKLAHGCGEALQDIVANVKKVTNLINEIAAASQEQAQGTTQIGQAMQQMDTVTQQNAATAEETASASEELFSQAKILTELVEKISRVVGSNGHAKFDGTGKFLKSRNTNLEHRIDESSLKLDEEEVLVKN